ncbi:MAG: hypothetical protein ACOYB4_04365 [Methyloceanibacter sp.]
MKRDLLTGTKGDAPSVLFLPSKREAAVLIALGLAALGIALLLRYQMIENTQLGLACEAEESDVICNVRLAVILLFTWGVFGAVAAIAASLQFWRPNVTVFGIGLVFALLGLVLYNTRLSALAAVLLVLSLARPVSSGR